MTNVFITTAYKLLYTIDKFEMYLSLYTIVVQVFKLNSNLCPRTENNIGDKIFTTKIS